MRPPPRLVICFSALLVGCGGAVLEAPPRPPPSYGLPAVPPRPAFDASSHAESHESGGICAIDPSACPKPTTGNFQFASDSAVYAVQQSGSASGATGVMKSIGRMTQLSGKVTGASSAQTVGLPNAGVAKAEEKIEREAQLAIEVKDVSEAASRVLLLARSHDGTITKDERRSGNQSSAELLVRVPSEHFDAFVGELGTVGEIRNRSVKALDTSLEHKDLGILVDNLEAALTRYRDLLQKATEPLQVLAIERELERVRADLDRVKGRLAFLKDRVARSTVAIGLHSTEPLPDATANDKPYIAPGLRGISFVDVRESGTNGYFGTGLSLRLPHASGDHGRGLVLDVDVMRACCKSRPDRSPWAYDVLTGIDLYSEALRSGRRRWFNPYLGVRVGFAQSQDRGDFAAAGVFGLEIWKSAVLMIDVQARAMALVGNPDGPHAAVQPSLGFDLGF